VNDIRLDFVQIFKLFEPSTQHIIKSAKQHDVFLIPGELLQNLYYLLEIFCEPIHELTEIVD
jgi:hypothetical protein